MLERGVCFSAVQKRWSTSGRGLHTGTPQTQREGPHTVSPCECEPPGPQTVSEPNPQALKPGGGQSRSNHQSAASSAQSWCTMLSEWLPDTEPSWRRRRHWKVVLSEPISSSSFSCSLANSMNNCETQRSKNTHPEQICWCTFTDSKSFH